jgi:antitoxin component of RelBE/YafQ-DinJ toxin-antitoxin module
MSVIQTRVDSKTREEAEKVLNSLGSKRDHYIS